MIRRNAPPGTEPELVWNPEFLREGSAVADCLSPDRVVLGLHPQDVSSEQRLRALYGLATRRSFFVTDYRTAELVKQAANAYLALKISYINAIAELCEQNGADVTMVSDALGADPRIGRGHLDSGIGYGGGCLPKDVRALISVAHEAGAYSLAGMLQAAQATNSARRDHAVARAASVLGPTPQGPIAVLGIAFKADTDDLREAPIVDVVNQLVDLGWEVRVYDPYVTAQRVPSCRAALEPTVSAACAGAQLVLLLGSHRLTGVTPEALGDVVGARRLLTVASRPELDRWRAAGWECIILGASATPHRTDPAVAVPAGSWTGRLPEHQ
ncbi:hypothetical protein nbrc107697_26180 [Gordonia crocea]|uniref:UDP-glucose 6-dehydrogenase n=2 Tax=Gordonia crocea TaxID=589162 RepID=A0A7I9V0E6_9ACTN|nr:hypothetical protein nbrc107697_26180 [Gordonia crocea]